MKLFRTTHTTLTILIFIMFPSTSFASYHFSNFRGTPPIHTFGNGSEMPIGITPAQIKKIYHIPEKTTQNKVTIAIIGAYHSVSIENDLNDFSKQFNIPPCTTQNKCFEEHLMSNKEKTDSGWGLETALDVEWTHAIAPNAKILLIEAATPSGANLLKAIDYATQRPDVVAVSMSWGGGEFPEEVTLDSHFKDKHGIVFFASSGDNGTGASWPASSPYVVSVGGTTLELNTNGSIKKESAWSGSGGGISQYEKQPDYQSSYSIPKSGGFRAIPDVAYNADPKSGFPIIHNGTWRTVGGTSAGAPQWAALSTLGSGANNSNFYSDKAGTNNNQYFTDITSGSNGDCGYVCDARKHYDYVTGLGTPMTVNF